ncbi:MAG: protein phosphatase CheZ [Candidatus Kapaibacteriota bacterium]
MKELDIQSLLHKAEELKALFVLGQRVVPFLEELFSFIGEIQPLLNEINQSIQENLSKMPNLSKQLSKVTEATELATNEILDIIDGVFYKLDILSTKNEKLHQIFNSLHNFFKEFSILVENKNSGKISSDEFANEALRQFNGLKKVFSLDFEFTEIKELLENIRADSTSIMLALQVQDITSQQIAAINHLLETVQNRLNTLLKKFSSSEVEQITKDTPDVINVTKLHREIAFDPDAVETLVGNSAKQEDIDKIFQEHSNDASKNLELEINKSKDVHVEDISEQSGPISQQDIDALFNQS